MQPTLFPSPPRFLLLRIHCGHFLFNTCYALKDFIAGLFVIVNAALPCHATEKTDSVPLSLWAPTRMRSRRREEISINVIKPFQMINWPQLLFLAG